MKNYWLQMSKMPYVFSYQNSKTGVTYAFKVNSIPQPSLDLFLKYMTLRSYQPEFKNFLNSLGFDTYYNYRDVTFMLSNGNYFHIIHDFRLTQIEVTPKYVEATFTCSNILDIKNYFPSTTPI